MKKLLTILGAVGLIATTSTATIACGKEDSSLKEWTLEQLNEKLNYLWKTRKELEKENENSGFPYPGDNPDLKDKWIQINFEVYSFLAKLYLQTDYILDHDNINVPSIRKAVNNSEYRESLESTIAGVDEGIEEMQENENFIKILKNYQNELNKKLKEIPENK